MNGGYIYLIGEDGQDNRYKIGSTRGKNINKRLKQLQTGNPNQLFIKESFRSERPFKLEKMLHYIFTSRRVNGEWFELDDEDLKSFKGYCEKYERMMGTLRNNPFF